MVYAAARMAYTATRIIYTAVRMPSLAFSRMHSRGALRPAENDAPLGVFGTYLPIWVLLCMCIGTVIGAIWP